MSKKTRGKIIVLVAPSGAGKTTMAQLLLREIPELKFSVSATTRPPREGETDGVDYFFLSPEVFQEKIDAGEFLEWEEFYNGYRYGTLQEAVESLLNDGYDVLLDVEVLGATNIKNNYGDEAFAIFLRPPSMEALKERLMKRGTESDKMLSARLQRAEEEMIFADTFDYALTNDDLEKAYEEIRTAVEGFIQR